MTASITCSDPEGNPLVVQTYSVLVGEVLNAELDIPEPQLWYPNGYGEQPLYSLELKLLDEEDMVLDTRRLQTGIRKLDYILNEGSPDNALPYTVVINGRKIYIKV